MAAVTLQPRARRWSEVALAARWPVALAFASVVVALWQGAGAAGLLPTYILPPTGVVRGVTDLVTSGELWPLLGASLRRSFAGFAIGAGLGVLLGLLAGVVRPLGELAELPVSFTYPLPKIALFPAFAVLLGFTDATRILVISLACFYPSFLNAQSGTRAIDPRLLWLARNVEASRTRTFLQVVVPAALPRLLAGVRISLALSFVLLFATEIIGFSDGLGAEIMKAFRDARYARMYGSIAVLGAAGLLSNALLLAAIDRLTHGQRPGSQHDA